MTGAEDRGDGGFSIVEVVVAMMLLALVVIVVLPALVSGLQLSIGQAQKSAAIRIANSVIEDARSEPNCAAIGALGGTDSDGRGGTLNVVASAPDCESKTAVDLTVTVSTADKTMVHTAHALVYVP